MNAPWRIQLFGGLRAVQADRVVTRFRTQKTGALLAYLAYRLDRSATRCAATRRELLIDLLWPDGDLDAGRHSLSTTLSSLRRQFEPPGVSAGAVIIADRAWVGLNPATVTTDVAEFTAALEAAERACSTTERVQSLAAAVELYEGDLLPGYYEDWIFPEREWLAERYFPALSQLLSLLEGAGELARALQYAHRGVRADPLREEAHQDLMRLYAAAGQPVAALRQYRELERRLREDLGETPSAATRELMEQLSVAQAQGPGARNPELEDRTRRAEALMLPRAPAAVPFDGPRAPSAGDPSVPATAAGTERFPFADGTKSACPGEEPPGSRRVVLLYKRHAPVDEQLLQWLETRLNADGYRVFIDRHMAIGEQWAREIAYRVRSADAVIPLLSAGSVQSEMLEYELQMAHQAAQQQGGRPRLLPVRVNYADPLPERLAPILQPLQYAVWESPADNDRLLGELLDALQRPPTLRPPVPPEELELVRGALPPGSPFYVERPTDGQFLAAIARNESIVLVKGPRQMGKTSLLARGLQHAREAGARVIQTDLQMLNATHLSSVETLYLTLAGWIADQLELEVFLDDIWSSRRGASGNFTWYVQREVLGKIAAPVVWGLDEIDALIACDFASEVLGLLRSWHNQRALDPTGRWTRLTLAIAYATEPHLLIRNVHQSPFNVGTQVTLQDFRLEEIAELNRRYDDPLPDTAAVERLARLVGGHPYLVHRSLQEMVRQAIDMDALEAEAAREDGIFGDHLKRLLVLLVENPALCEEVREVLRGRPCRSVESFHRLRSAGVVLGDSPREARPRCRLYATYLERSLR